MLTLIILDGWGYRTDKAHNPTITAPTPTIDQLFATYPHRLIEASGEAVGLPEGQIGNSEVGHLHLGAGRRIPQQLTRIREAITSGDLAQHDALQHAIAHAKTNQKAIHILGLTSPGGVHSHEDHILSLLDILSEAPCLYLHAFLDGRDVAPRSAAPSLKKLEAKCNTLGNARIASIIGRYYAMDRDERWDRVEKAYDLIIDSCANFYADNAVDGLKAAYARNEDDEFVQATRIGAAAPINNGDIILFMNFRADRARQLSYALTNSQFTHFNRKRTVDLNTYITLTNYADDLSAEVLFKAQRLSNTLGDVLAQHSLKQLRIAETEKYAHVTYFFNGGNETPYQDEERMLIHSPKVATYDLQPEMSAVELTDKLTDAICSKKYNVIICNYANPDMVGHTGINEAAEVAMSTIDTCLQRVLEASQSVDNELLITADHGNIEKMFDEKTDQPHTAHTTNLVPLLFIGRAAQFKPGKASLADIAPTILALLKIKQPPEMTGHNLLDL